MPHEHQNLHTLYRAKIFWSIFLPILVIGLLGCVIIYVVRTRDAFAEQRQELSSIASAIAEGVSAVGHESLQTPEQMSSETYGTIEKYFQTVMDGNLYIDDVYTLRPTASEHVFTFIVSAKETSDDNNNGIIEPEEEKAGLGERYPTEEFPELEAGLKGPSADRSITYDKWGAWLSGYAPIRNEHGTAVALVGVDYPASRIIQRNRDVFNSLLTAFLILLPIAAAGSYFLSRRLSTPLRVLAEGMDRVAHGDVKYRLPMRGRHEEAVFAQLFNNMLNLYNPSERPRQPGVERTPGGKRP